MSSLSILLEKWELVHSCDSGGRRGTILTKPPPPAAPTLCWVRDLPSAWRALRTELPRANPASTPRLRTLQWLSQGWPEEHLINQSHTGGRAVSHRDRAGNHSKQGKTWSSFQGAFRYTKKSAKVTYRQCMCTNKSTWRHPDDRSSGRKGGDKLC